jgi:hypothetical protein
VADKSSPANVSQNSSSEVCEEDSLAYQNLPCSNAVDSNAVTMPKLFEPPLRASHKSEFDF